MKQRLDNDPESRPPIAACFPLKATMGHTLSDLAELHFGGELHHSCIGRKLNIYR
ncbi:hypothetical protein METH_07745 [Leisingera methylohalidivorans DSM 14336]|uniref:Uncharacterized protein n=1 Tax=Leisingera methylohalidivorans DSM 14336 TaxID=999552 RepID=V9VW55_9RHOB|nr:hypothetical protein METH_07745 [Leisingera methylohalidivorans DSM 14336]